MGRFGRRVVVLLRGRAIESGGGYRPLVEAFVRPSAPSRRIQVCWQLGRPWPGCFLGGSATLALRRRRCPVIVASDDGFTQRAEGLAVGPRSDDRQDSVAQPAR
jgi:hypothetical protein